MTLSVVGRLDTTTAEILEDAVKSVPETVRRLRLDFSALEYVSSSGLRVILFAHKTLAARGAILEIAGVNAMIKHIFDITGFTPILTFA